MIDPGVDFGGRHAEGNGGEEVVGLGLALPVILRTVIDVGGAGGNGVEAFEGGDELAGGEDLDVELAAGHLADADGEPLGGGAEARIVLRPGGDHLELALALRDGRRGHGGGGKTRKARARQKRTAFHRRLPDLLPQTRPPFHGNGERLSFLILSRFRTAKKALGLETLPGGQRAATASPLKGYNWRPV